MQLSIGQKIKRKSHISAFRASREIVPYLGIVFKNSVGMAVGLAKWLELEPEMIAYLAESEDKAEEIVKMMG
jgi:hypothetical protein